MGCLLGYVLIQKIDTPWPVQFGGMLGATASQHILFHGTIKVMARAMFVGL